MKIDKDTQEFLNMIESLNNEERIELREFYQSFDAQVKLPRDMFFNYQLQVWF